MVPRKTFHRCRPATPAPKVLPPVLPLCGLTAVAFATPCILGTPAAHSSSTAAPPPALPNASVQLPRFVPEYQPIGIRSGEAASVLWQSAPLTASSSLGTSASPQQIRQNIRAILMADPVLGEAYQWRQVLRGNATQQWKLTESAAGEMQLQIGKHSLPVMQLSGIRGTRAAAGLSGQRFGFYSTKPLSILNSRLQAADEMLGDAVSHDASEVSWMSLRPLSSSRGTVDIVYMQGQNDLNPNSALKLNGQLRRGAMAGAKVAFLLPAKWKLDGEWMNGRMEDKEPDNAIILALAGPIKHPWGETGVRFSYRDVGADFSSFAGTPGDAGLTTKQLTLNQPFKTGDISGAVGLNWQQYAPNTDESTRPSDTNLQATSNLRWQATPAVAVTASHSAGNRSIETRPTNLLLGEETIERENSDSRFGLEWKLSKKFSLSATGGVTQYDEETATDRFMRRLSNRDNHYSVALKNQGKSTQWNVKYERREALDLEGDTGRIADTISFGAQKKLTSWLKFGGTYRLADTEYSGSGLEVPASDLTANTTLSLQELGSLELRYTQAMSTLSDGVRLNGQNRARAYGVRYVLGSQSGFGLSIDYTRREYNGPADEQWKVGLTYR